MLVTLLCDASHCPDTKAAGFGYWIASGRGKDGGGDIIRFPVEAPRTAEMMAIVNTLHIAMKKGLLQRGDKALIQSDCKEAMLYLAIKQSVLSFQELSAYDAFHKLISIGEFQEVEFRHVKAHTNRREPRYAANRHCDIRAKLHMRKMRRRFRGDMEAYK